MDFTCTLKQGGSTVASTTTSATWTVRDGWCSAQLFLTANASGSAGTEVKITVSGLPAPKTSGVLAGGIFFYNDTGASGYVGAARWNGTDIQFRAHNAGTELGATPSFTVASTDTISVTLFPFPVA